MSFLENFKALLTLNCLLESASERSSRLSLLLLAGTRITPPLHVQLDFKLLITPTLSTILVASLLKIDAQIKLATSL
jgi:hypothetical protein